MTWVRAWALAGSLLAVPSLCSAHESGTLILSLLQHRIGQETYDLTEDGAGGFLLQSAFSYTDRGVQVGLTSRLETDSDWTPKQFDIHGKSYRYFSVDASVHRHGLSATVPDDNQTHEVRLPERFFTINGYAPFSMQMALLRYWERHGRPQRLTQLPAGISDADITIQISGRDVIASGERRMVLTRYSIGNIVWGRESVWLDEKNQIAAATSYAGGLPLEAIRSEYQAALPQLMRSSRSDRLHELTSLSDHVRPLQQGSFAIVGATLIDGTGRAPVPEATVLIRDGRIVRVGTSKEVRVPGGMAIVEAKAATLLPGLWDMHAHFEQVEWGPTYLAAGVTTVRDCGNEFDFVTNVRKRIDEEGALGPHLLLAGLVDGSGPGAFGSIWANTPEQGREVVRRYKAAGFDQMKIYDLIKPDVLTAIAAEAHQDGMTVTGHVPKGMTAMQAVEAGMDQINHLGLVYQAFRIADPSLTFDPPPAASQHVIDFLRSHHTVVDPTMSWGELLGRPTNVEIASFEPGFAKAPYTLTSLLETAGTTPNPLDPQAERMRKMLSVVYALYKAGIPIVAGTDKALPGHSLHRELELYVQAGLTPMEAIETATRVSATVMGLQAEVGTIEAGKRADMILVDGNPLVRFADLRNVNRVVKNGRLYDTSTLWKSVGFRP